MATVVVRAALPSVRRGLAAMLAEAGHRVVEEDDQTEGLVWLVDAPELPVLERLGAAEARDLPRPIVILADDPALVARVFRLGRPGWACLSRDCGAAELDLAIRAAAAGLVLLDLPSAAATAPAGLSPMGHPELIERLTPRELEILQLLAEGLPNKGIARALGITENTAKFHVASLCAKLGAANRAEVVAQGARFGLLVL